MTRRSVRSALAGRGFVLFPAAAFAVHQLRYDLAYGSRSGAVLSAQGHGYLDSLAPWVVVLLALGLGSFLVRVARAGAGQGDGTPRRALTALWALSSAGLIVVYSAQEWLEGSFEAGHPGGLAGIFGHGGWWALPLAAAFGLVVALLLRAASVVVETIARLAARRRLRVMISGLSRPVEVPHARRAVLAGNSSGRAPPGTSPASRF
jgi:hypothetical protein